MTSKSQHQLLRTIVEFLNKPETRELLGVDPAVGNYSTCSNTVGRAFWGNQDEWSHYAQHYVAELLERGVKVLVYVGTYDLVCNWVSFHLHYYYYSLISFPLWSLDWKSALYSRSRMVWPTRVCFTEAHQLGSRWQGCW